MNYFSIAYSNFKRNVNTYRLYIMSMIFSVMVYYNFIELKYNPDFQKANMSNLYIDTMSKIVAYLLLAFIMFFIWFSSSFFLKQRKKEIGIYAFMGVTNYQIAYIYTIEVLIIGVTSIIIGLFLGIIFCKLFLMMLAKVAILNMKVNFFFSIKAVIETTVIFFTIFLANSIFGYINIVRSKLIDLFNISKREEQIPKLNYIKGILSIIFIGIGYYFALNVKSNFVKNSPLAILLVVFGTYWLFGAGYSIFMKYLLNKKKFLYNGTNIVSISNIAFRVKNNYRTLATVAILITITLTCYGTVASLKYFVQIRDSIQTPYDISYVSNDKSVKEEVKRKIEKNNSNIMLEENTKFLMIKPHMKTQFHIDDKNNVAIALKYYDFMRISNDLKVKDLKKIEKYDLSDNEVLCIDVPTVVMSLVDYENKEVDINNEKYIIKNNLKTPLFGMGIPAPCIVLNDDTYNKLKSTTTEYEFNGLKISNTENIKSLAKDLESIDSIKDSLYTNENKDKSTYSIFGILYFLGAFLSLVFIVATGSIIYFKLVSEAYMDKNKFVILKRIGMTDREVNKAVSKQIGICYIMPLAIGIIHSCVAMISLSKLMNYNILIPTVMSVIIFIIVYLIYFVATKIKYLKILS
jgi:putative ABC transport system permease protein